ncbi:MAG: hypothetical protein CM15mP49_29510 [Actinomycetota bacterium]|nr:MAG: hypothetical protein CM15mP49_29510 [Actinomycetota bacterium]
MTEGGSTDLITVVLDAQPTSDVVISVASSDTVRFQPPVILHLRQRTGIQPRP